MVTVKQILIVLMTILLLSSLHGENKKSNLSQVAMIMVKKAYPYSEKEMSNALKRDWPELPLLNKYTGARGTSIFQLGNYKIVIAAMLTPISSNELTYPINTALFWNNASQEIKLHKRHYVVFVSSPRESKINVNLVCTKVVKTLASMTRAIGIYWGSSSQVINKRTFNVYCTMMKKKTYPVPIWIKVTGFRKKNGTYYVYSVGMHAFGHRELEIQSYKGSFKDVYFFMLDLADYVLKQGKVIKNGDTIGGASKDKLKVIFKKSDINKKINVMSIKFL
jgi:hypothetical protein